MVIIPIKTVSGLNAREHWRQRTRRVKAERTAVAWALRAAERPPIPCAVLLTRIAPSNGLDPDDNLPSSMKGVRDQIAEWLGVDDRKRQLVRYLYAQERGPYGVRIEFQPPTTT